MAIDFDKPTTQLLEETPQFFDQPGLDRLYAMLLALTEEVASQMEQTANLEALLIDKGVLQPGELQAYTLTSSQQAERLGMQQAFVARLLAVLESEFNVEQ